MRQSKIEYWINRNMKPLIHHERTLLIRVRLLSPILCYFLETFVSIFVDTQMLNIVYLTKQTKDVLVANEQDTIRTTI